MLGIIVKRRQKIICAKLHNFDHAYQVRAIQRAKVILAVPLHPFHVEFLLLPSEKRVKDTSHHLCPSFRAWCLCFVRVIRNLGYLIHFTLTFVIFYMNLCLYPFIVLVFMAWTGCVGYSCKTKQIGTNLQMVLEDKGHKPHKKRLLTLILSV